MYSADNGCIGYRCNMQACAPSQHNDVAVHNRNQLQASTNTGLYANALLTEHTTLAGGAHRLKQQMC
jgi:hypothetical protein